jgi:hypothetical protein
MVFWGLGREIGDFLGLRLTSQIFYHKGHRGKRRGHEGFLTTKDTKGKEEGTKDFFSPQGRRGNFATKDSKGKRESSKIFLTTDVTEKS